MKISRMKLRQLIVESTNPSFSAAEGKLKVNTYVYSLTTSGISLFLKSIKEVPGGISVTITPPYVPFLSDGKDKTGILKGEKLEVIKRNTQSGVDKFDVDMADGTKITFIKG